MSINRNGLLASTDVWRSGDPESNLYLRDYKIPATQTILSSTFATTWTNDEAFYVSIEALYTINIIVSIGVGASLDPSGLGYASFSLYDDPGSTELAETVLPLKNIYVPTTMGQDCEYRLLFDVGLTVGNYRIKTEIVESAFENTLGTDGYIDIVLVSRN
jgi:hypothetical protein